MGRLDGRVALITGGARGQGASEARLFCSEGASVVIGDVLEAEGKALADELGERAEFVRHDVTSEDGWAEAVRVATERFGALDVLVNNAGVFKIMPITMTSLEEYERIVRINQTGVFLGMKAVIPTMTAARRGSIINISSVAGLRGNAMTIAYAASKWAVRGMTKVAAHEVAQFGVRVNSIHPGIIDTPMMGEFTQFGDAVLDGIKSRIPMGDVAGPEEVAKLALFLASDDSAYCTGAEFIVDGGMTA